MVEKYIAMKMFFEFKLPLILLAIVLGIWLFCVVIGLINRWFEKRQKKMIDKYFKDDEEE